jgi:hypothetical protein
VLQAFMFFGRYMQGKWKGFRVIEPAVGE